MVETYDVVICGAGIAGISAAYYLSAHHGINNILLVDGRAPLSLTSDKSTECYRNWWPGPGNAMVALMNRSIDLLDRLAEESGNIFNLNRRGYLYLTGNAERISEFQMAAREPSELGAGSVRVHDGRPGASPYIPSRPEGFKGVPSGADLLLDPAVLFDHFPYLNRETIAGLHVRRAGWFSAQQLGAYLLGQVRARGVKYLQTRVAGVDVVQGRVDAVCMQDGSLVATRNFVNAAGPLLGDVGGLLGLELPVFNELHLKVAIKDQLGVIPRDAPLLIWSDPQYLSWSSEERELLGSDPESRWLLDRLPPGVHARPEGGPDSPVVLMLWEYRIKEMQPIWPLPLDPDYPEIALRGLAKMIPGLRAYFGRLPHPVLDGGYYTKTRENRPLIGPLPVKGAYLIGALSGYGLMASQAAGDLLARHIAGADLPDYTPDFLLERYHDPVYVKQLETWGETGQL
jgi:glycine/D-amino acid oxidase-like deaminating enzyme